MSITNRLRQLAPVRQLELFLASQLRFTRGGVLLGRETGAGVSEEIEVGTGLSLSGGTLSAVLTNEVVNTAIELDPSASQAALGLPLNNYEGTIPPTVSNDETEGYSVGSKWYDTVAAEAYVCTSATEGAAVWLKATLTADELGDSAFLDVGTTAGTVAAGDHTHVSAPVYYFTNQAFTGDGLWSTLANWSRDSLGTIPATELPGPDSDVFLQVSCSTGEDQYVVRNLTVGAGASLISTRFQAITCKRADFSAASGNEGTIYAENGVYFNGPSSANAGYIQGDAYFVSGGSYNLEDAVVTGVGYFVDPTVQNEGTCGSVMTLAAKIGAADLVHTHSLADITDAGDSASLDVGTTAGTVAAGDHTHDIYSGLTRVAPSGATAGSLASNVDGTGQAARNALGEGAVDLQSVRSVSTDVASGSRSFIAGGAFNEASGYASHAEGSSNTASGSSSHVEGKLNTASGEASHAQGGINTASGSYSHAGGISSTASGYASLANGNFCSSTNFVTIALGNRAHAIHSGAFVFADGQNTTTESTTTNECNFRFENGYHFLGGAADFATTPTINGSDIALVSQIPTGDAASLDVGTTAGTVAAGDHVQDITRIDIAGGTEIGGALADGDLIVLHDISGTPANKTATMSRVWTYNKAQIDLGQIWTGTQTFTGAVSVGQMTVAAANPQFFLYNTTASLNQKQYDTLVGDGVLTLRLLDDFNTVGTPYMQVNRSGMTVNSIAFPNGTIDIAGTLEVGSGSWTGATFTGPQVFSDPLQALSARLINGDFATAYTKTQITLSLDGTTNSYSHYIHTRHNNGSPVNNAIDFFTCDGTAAGTFQTNSVHGLTISAGRVGVANTAPSEALDVTGNGVISGNLKVGGTNTWNGSTFTGAQAFSSTTRPTSAGTGTPGATDLITRNDGDARYAAALGSDDNYVTDAEKTRIGYISVTQAVDLDTIETQAALGATALQPSVSRDEAGNVTLALTDAYDVIRMTNGTSSTVTIPTNATVAFPTGTVIYFRRTTSAGPVTLSGAGVTINDNTASSVPAGGMFAIRKIATDTWDFI